MTSHQLQPVLRTLMLRFGTNQVWRSSHSFRGFRLDYGGEGGRQFNYRWPRIDDEFRPLWKLDNLVMLFPDFGRYVFVVDVDAWLMLLSAVLTKRGEGGPTQCSCASWMYRSTCCDDHPSHRNVTLALAKASSAVKTLEALAFSWECREYPSEAGRNRMEVTHAQWMHATVLTSHPDKEGRS